MKSRDDNKSDTAPPASDPADPPIPPDAAPIPDAETLWQQSLRELSRDELRQRFTPVVLALRWQATYAPIRDVLPNLVSGSDDVDGDSLIPTRLNRTRLIEQDAAFEGEYLRRQYTREGIENLRVQILKEHDRELLPLGSDEAEPTQIPQKRIEEQVREVVKEEIGATQPETDVTGLFTHSEDYRTVTLRGKTYELTFQQAQVIQILHKAHENGKPNVPIAGILESLEKNGSKWQYTFRSNLEAKKALVITGARKGTLRLNL